MRFHSVRLVDVALALARSPRPWSHAMSYGAGSIKKPVFVAFGHSLAFIVRSPFEQNALDPGSNLDLAQPRSRPAYSSSIVDIRPARPFDDSATGAGGKACDSISVEHPIRSRCELRLPDRMAAGLG